MSKIDPDTYYKRSVFYVDRYMDDNKYCQKTERNRIYLELYNCRMRNNMKFEGYKFDLCMCNAKYYTINGSNNFYNANV